MLPDPYVLIAVSDPGAGITPEAAARAFDPVFSTKDKGPGTGPGLSLVYGFIKQSGGHTKIDSEAGDGTVVKICLPRTAGELVAQAPVPARPEVPAAAPGEIELLVEDDDAVRKVHVKMLRGLNDSVRHATGGDQALQIRPEQPGVKLLFTEVVMPGMGGRELADQAKRLKPDLKILFTTGCTANAIGHNGIIDAAVDRLPKPFAFEMLSRK